MSHQAASIAELPARFLFLRLRLAGLLCLPALLTVIILFLFLYVLAPADASPAPTAYARQMIAAPTQTAFPNLVGTASVTDTSGFIPADLLASAATQDVEVGDFNGDGALDIVAGNSGSPGQVYFNDGSGHFVQGLALGTGSDSPTVATGDLNGDGWLDILLGNQVYLNNGHGSFTPSVSVGTGQAGLVGDLNGDGLLDIVSSGQIYWNNGNMDFTPGISLSVAGAGVVGDFNNNGTLDLVLGNQIFWNDGHGNFTANSNVIDSAFPLAVGDLNGDGSMDLVMLAGRWKALVLLNDGLGNFTSSSSDLGTTVHAVALADFNTDGNLDILVTNGLMDLGPSIEPSQIYLNTGDGTFTAGPLVAGFATDVRGVAVGDLNRDGILDVVFGNYQQPSQVFWGTGLSNVLFTDGPIVRERMGYQETRDIAVGDFDGNRTLDIAISDSRTGTGVLLNDGVGNFSERHGLSTTYGFMGVGDFNNDGTLDISLRDKVYWNDGNGNFTPGSALAGGGGDIVGDFNNDGTLDIVGSSVNWNDGHGNFTLGPVVACGGRVVRDFNNDGALDIAGDRVCWNDGQGNFTPGPILATGASAKAVSDFNDDGALDIVLISGGQTVVVYLNDGHGNFTSSIVVGNGRGTNDIAVGDLNNDEWPDIVVASCNDNVACGIPSQVFLNDGGRRFILTQLLNTANATSVALGDFRGTGVLDIVIGEARLTGVPPAPRDRSFWNTLRQPVPVLNNPPRVSVTRPDTTAYAPFYSTPIIQENNVVPITYTLFDPEGDSVGSIRAYYSPTGGGKWYPAMPASNTLTANLSAALVYTMAYPSFNWIDLTTTGTPITLTDDSITGPIELGFGFPFFQQTPSQLWISSNGWMALTATTSTAYNNVCLPSSSSEPTNIIAPFWDDLNPSAGGSIYYRKVTSDTFVVEYYQVPYYSGSGNYTFEAILRKDGSIVFQYQTMTGTLNSATIGIQNVTGNRGFQLACDTAYAQNNLAVRLERIGQTHIYNWDTFASSLFGQSDDVVFRIEAYPYALSGTVGITGEYRYFGSVPIYQHPYTFGNSFPFRVRGTQVQAFSGTTAISNAVAGAMVYRMPAGQSTDAQPLADDSGKPFRTDAHGYLMGRGRIGISDTLVALLPITFTDSYTLYYSSFCPKTGISRKSIGE